MIQEIIERRLVFDLNSDIWYIERGHVDERGQQVEEAPGRVDGEGSENTTSKEAFCTSMKERKEAAKELLVPPNTSIDDVKVTMINNCTVLESILNRKKSERASASRSTMQQENNCNTTAHFIVNTDGCAAQYKCRQTQMAVANCAERHKDILVTHRVAPKFSFKGNWDADGKVLKKFLKDGELKRTSRTRNAWEAFVYAKDELVLKRNTHAALRTCTTCDKDYAIVCEANVPINATDCVFANSNAPALQLEYKRRFCEGTGGQFSSIEAFNRAPPYTTFCANDDILNKKPSTIDSRTIKFVTSSKERYFHLSSKKQYRKDIIFCDRRSGVTPDPGTSTLSGIQSMYEFKGSTMLKKDEECMEAYKIDAQTMFCSCSVCRSLSGNSCISSSGANLKKECPFSTQFDEGYSKSLVNLADEESFRCLCCNRTIHSFQLALRHVVQQTCHGLKEIIYSDESPGFQRIYDLCIAKRMTRWTNTDAENYVTSISRRGFSATELKSCTWTFKKSYQEVEEVRDNMNGCLLEDNSCNLLPYITSESVRDYRDVFLLPHTSSSLSSSQSNTTTTASISNSWWILSIDGYEVKSKDDIIFILRGKSGLVSEALKILNDTLPNLKRQSDDFSIAKIKGEYLKVAKEWGVPIMNRNAKIDTLHKLIENHLIGLMDENHDTNNAERIQAIENAKHAIEYTLPRIKYKADTMLPLIRKQYLKISAMFGLAIDNRNATIESFHSTTMKSLQTLIYDHSKFTSTNQIGDEASSITYMRHNVVLAKRNEN